SLLVLNKDLSNNFNAQVTLNGFIPDATAGILRFCIPQDEAAPTNAPLAAQDISSTNFVSSATNFNYTFPRLSMTLFSFAPTAPHLVALPALPDPSSALVLRVEGQAGARYVLQQNSNLSNPNGWSAVSTNTLIGSSLDLTNAIAPGAPIAFWR